MLTSVNTWRARAYAGVVKSIKLPIELIVISRVTELSIGTRAAIPDMVEVGFIVRKKAVV